MNIFSAIILYFAILVAGIFAVEYGEIEYHRIEKRQFNFGQWGRNMGQRGENYGRDWGRQW